MEETKSLLEQCDELSLEELDSLSLTKMVRKIGGEPKFIGLGIIDKEGYLLEYDELKKIYVGLYYFMRNVNPELITKINEQKRQEDQIQREKDELIELVSKNIVEKDELQEEKPSFFRKFFRRNE